MTPEELATASAKKEPEELEAAGGISDTERLDAIGEHGFSVWVDNDLTRNKKQWRASYGVGAVASGDTLREAINLALIRSGICQHR